MVNDGLPGMIKGILDARVFKLDIMLGILAPAMADTMTQLNVVARVLRLMVYRMDTAARVIIFRRGWAVGALHIAARTKYVTMKRDLRGSTTKGREKQLGACSGNLVGVSTSFPMMLEVRHTTAFKQVAASRRKLFRCRVETCFGAILSLQVWRLVANIKIRKKCSYFTTVCRHRYTYPKWLAQYRKLPGAIATHRRMTLLMQVRYMVAYRPQTMAFVSVFTLVSTILCVCSDIFGRGTYSRVPQC